MSEYKRCINCEHHALYDLKCNLNNPNYEKRKKDINFDLSECFVKSKTHESMDKVIDLTSELIKKIDNKLSKKQISMVANIHSAMCLIRVDDFMFDETCNVSEEDRQAIIKQINVVAEKLSKGNPMNLGSTQSIVEYVRKEFK